MDRLSCKTPTMAVKELWVYLLAYNLIRQLMFRAALHAEIPPRHLSFKHCVQLWRAWRVWNGAYRHESSVTLLRLMAQRRVGQRPGRIEPRAVKRRPKPFGLLMQPRAQARTHTRLWPSNARKVSAIRVRAVFTGDRCCPTSVSFADRFEFHPAREASEPCACAHGPATT
jgi:hypothetical protein